jgi:hypothetical protein
MNKRPRDQFEDITDSYYNSVDQGCEKKLRSGDYQLAVIPIEKQIINVDVDDEKPLVTVSTDKQMIGADTTNKQITMHTETTNVSEGAFNALESVKQNIIPSIVENYTHMNSYAIASQQPPTQRPENSFPLPMIRDSSNPTQYKTLPAIWYKKPEL